MPDPMSLTYYGGIILGCLLLLAVLVVYVLNKKVEVGGIMLTLIGFSLLGLPIWKTLDIDPKGLHVAARDVTTREERSSSGGSVPDLRPSVVSTARYKVAIVNKSTTTEDRDIEAIVPALQKQVTEHLSPVWGVSADLTFIPKGAKVPDNAWTLVFLDESDQPGMLSYHDVSKDGLPIGKVFVLTAKGGGYHWSVTASHELLNMLVDPRINLTVFVSSNNSGGTLYTQEIASPCQAEEDGYTIDGIRVSDFVYPSWFEPGAKSGTQFDYAKRVKEALELCSGGWISVYKVRGGKWEQKFGHQ